jgi:hypothetical protein
MEFIININYMLNININILLSTGDQLAFFSVTAGSTYSNTGGTIHTATRIAVHRNYNSNTMDYDVPFVQVFISFNVSIYNAMCITYCCDNQLYLTLLLCKMQFF